MFNIKMWFIFSLKEARMRFFSFVDDLLKDDGVSILVKYAKIITFVLVFLLAISFIGFFLNWGEKLGTFGDFIGGVANPLLTFLTFICLIKTIFMQREELILTRNEYSETKNVLKKQSVENNFYNGVNLHHEIINNLNLDFKGLNEHYAFTSTISTRDLIGKDEEKYLGRDCFRGVIKFLNAHNPNKEMLIELFKNINKHRNEWFGHYFRNLYRVIKIIDDLPSENFSEKDKIQYCHILRAQLSSNELAILIINCYPGVCDNGRFRDFLIKYHMLEHLPLNVDLTKKVHVSGAFWVDDAFLKKFITPNINTTAEELNSKPEDIIYGAFGKRDDERLIKLLTSRDDEDRV